MTCLADTLPLGIAHRPFGLPFSRGDVAGSRFIFRHDRDLAQAVILVKERYNCMIDAPAHGKANNQGKRADHDAGKGQQRTHFLAGTGGPRRRGPEDRRHGSSLEAARVGFSGSSPFAMTAILIMANRPIKGAFAPFAEFHSDKPDAARSCASGPSGQFDQHSPGRCNWLSVLSSSKGEHAT